jgi:bifunctional NMN adenylyltransferase/nudix hydrolase
MAKLQVELERSVTFHIEPNIDTMYNDTAWAMRVQEIVAKYTRKSDSIAIIGHVKDESSFYLKMFPQWHSCLVPELIEPLNATQIRDLYFNDNVNLNFLSNVVPPATLDFLNAFKETSDYKQLVREKDFIAQYKRQFDVLPYPPTFVTMDAVIIQGGHVLMIKRRAEPGKGLWAFPGGFLNAKTDKSLESAMLRELREETGIKLPDKVLKASIRHKHVFDAIERSSRGRTITHAFNIVLNDGEYNLPKVKGSDDAEKAAWIPLSEVKRSECYEDHYDILQYFLGMGNM